MAPGATGTRVSEFIGWSSLISRLREGWDDPAGSSRTGDGLPMPAALMTFGKFSSIENCKPSNKRPHRSGVQGQGGGGSQLSTEEGRGASLFLTRFYSGTVVADLNLPDMDAADKIHHAGTAGSNAVIGVGEADRMMRIIIRLIVVGSVLMLPACATRPIDILCPPAGQCPNVHGWHGGGDEG
jgi:hypothetical protein